MARLTKTGTTVVPTRSDIAFHLGVVTLAFIISHLTLDRFHFSLTPR
jgi:hypothetical protein